MIVRINRDKSENRFEIPFDQYVFFSYFYDVSKCELKDFIDNNLIIF